MDNDTSSADEFKQTRLKEILLQYTPADIYNADETGLYFRTTPDRTHAFADEKLSGGKKSKERVTIMVCSNMDGSDKRKLLVIGKSANPRCLKNVKRLPVEYTANKNAWMTSEKFEHWLGEFNEDMKKQARKVALIVDNAPSHPMLTPSNIKLYFLPPNTTALVQPMDQGIIKNLKGHYRKELCSRILQTIDTQITSQSDLEAQSMEKHARSISLLDAIHMVAEAWTSVKPTTIYNCYAKCGFVRSQTLVLELSDISLDKLSAPLCMSQEIFDDFLAFDDCCIDTHDEQDLHSSIVTELKDKREPPCNDSDDESESSVEPVSRSELLAAFSVIRRHGMIQCDESLLSDLNAIETRSFDHFSLKQACLTDFFK